jgi:hypothetical protein
MLGGSGDEGLATEGWRPSRGEKWGASPGGLGVDVAGVVARWGISAGAVDARLRAGDVGGERDIGGARGVLDGAGMATEAVGGEDGESVGTA